MTQVRSQLGQKVMPKDTLIREISKATIILMAIIECWRHHTPTHEKPTIQNH